MQKSFDRYMDKIGIDIPSVSCYKKYMNSLPGQEGVDIGNIFLKSGSIVFATFKEEDNPRKGFKFETIGKSEIAEKLDNTADWMDSLERYSYPLRTFVDKDMPMKEVLSVLYRISSSRPRVAFVLRDKDTSAYIYFHYRIKDSISTIEVYDSIPYYKRIEVFKFVYIEDSFATEVQKYFPHYKGVEVSKFDRANTFGVICGDNWRLEENLTNFFDTLLSSPNPNSYVLVVNTERMTFEDCISIVYEFARIVHKYRNDYCLKTYGKPYETLDHPKQKEIHALFPQNIMLL
ncbi:MAG: hypothetical protein IK103_04975 [Bacteroidales bacterium]|nr:hypothetical protein [Bacteroidales bacterium]